MLPTYSTTQKTGLSDRERPLAACPFYLKEDWLPLDFTSHSVIEYLATFTVRFCYTRVSPLHYLTACLGFSDKFAKDSRLQVSRIFPSFRLGVYYRCQNLSCLSRRIISHPALCVAFWTSSVDSRLSENLSYTSIPE